MSFIGRSRSRAREGKGGTSDSDLQSCSPLLLYSIRPQFGPVRNSAEKMQLFYAIFVVVNVVVADGEEEERREREREGDYEEAHAVITAAEQPTRGEESAVVAFLLASSFRLATTVDGYTHRDQGSANQLSLSWSI